MHLTEHEQLVFDIYFASVASMARHHPGVGRSNGFARAADQLTIEECADEALLMIKERRKVVAR